MAIKVSFPANVKTVTISPLTQWDYGQTLEIEIVGLSGIIEVHFSYKDAKDAIVRTCSVVNGVATVAIPDICLEQSLTVDAWVYEILDGGGATKRTITIPITARTRPEVCEYVPPDFDNRYNEAISAMNELVSEFDAGMSAAMSAINSATNASITNVNTVTIGAIESVRSERDRAIASFSNFFPTPNPSSLKLNSFGYYYVVLYFKNPVQPNLHIIDLDCGLICWYSNTQGFKKIYTSPNWDYPISVEINSSGVFIAKTTLGSSWMDIEIESVLTAKIGG